MGALVGAAVGAFVGAGVGDAVGELVGALVGVRVGGLGVGADVGVYVGPEVDDEVLVGQSHVPNDTTVAAGVPSPGVSVRNLQVNALRDYTPPLSLNSSRPNSKI